MVENTSHGTDEVKIIIIQHGHAQLISTLPVAVIIHSAITVTGLVAIAPIKVGQHNGPISAVEQVFGRIIFRIGRGSIDNDIFFVRRDGIDNISTIDIASRLGLGAIDATITAATSRPTRTVAVVFWRIGAITRSGQLITNRLKRGALYIQQHHELQWYMYELIKYGNKDNKDERSISRPTRNVVELQHWGHPDL